MKLKLSKRDRQEVLLAIDLAVSREIEVIERLSRENSRMISAAVSARQQQIRQFEKLRRSLMPEQAMTGIRE